MNFSNQVFASPGNRYVYPIITPNLNTNLITSTPTNKLLICPDASTTLNSNLPISAQKGVSIIHATQPVLSIIGLTSDPSLQFVNNFSSIPDADITLQGSILNFRVSSNPTITLQPGLIGINTDTIYNYMPPDNQPAKFLAINSSNILSAVDYPRCCWIYQTGTITSGANVVDTAIFNIGDTDIVDAPTMRLLTAGFYQINYIFEWEKDVASDGVKRYITAKVGGSSQVPIDQTPAYYSLSGCQYFDAGDFCSVLMQTDNLTDRAFTCNIFITKIGQKY